jgi:hypothetical protein
MVHVRPDGIVESALRASDDGWSDATNAHWHGVAVKTVRRWRRLYQRRGLPRGQSHTRAACPVCEGASLDEPAYAELFGWYLGDGHITSARSGVHSLHIFDDRRYTDLNEHVLELMRRVKPGGRPHVREVPGCLVMTVGWKHWPCLFPQHGPGRKHTRELGMADWQWEVVRRHPADFLRGLFHSDGSRSRNWTQRLVAGELKRYDYPRWQFTNYSAEIRGWCCDALDLVDVPWRQSNHKTISVSTRAGVARLDELIGLKA